ncbi:MAG: ribosome-associated translation inhibitor RaiA [Ruminococcaceae bacterium]|nr:ribosome-associated translation inhibitor RaiA [Oscillospiraceae bacterium]
MNINVIGRKVNLRENFKVLVNKKLAKFQKIFDENAEATVKVTLEKNRQIVEITIKQRGVIYRAEANAPEMNEALDIVVNKLQKQIRKNKTRLENLKKVSVIDFSEEYYDEPEEEHNVTKVKRFALKPMNVDEAILQMELLGHEFFMFKDEASAKISVVYKRKDGDYGLLESEDE